MEGRVDAAQEGGVNTAKHTNTEVTGCLSQRGGGLLCCKRGVRWGGGGITQKKKIKKNGP